MSKYKENAKRVHNNTDFRTQFAGVTQVGEFVYDEHESRVQPGLQYHIHYTNSKNEVFMLDGFHSSSSKIIKKVGGVKSLFTRYSELSETTKEKYPVIIIPIPSDSDYRTGSFTRYFTQIANDLTADIFEISEEDNDQQNNLFRYIDFKWRISGTKSEVTRDNQRTMNNINSDFVGIIRKLFPLQLWKPKKNSPTDLQNKLLLLKKF